MTIPRRGRTELICATALSLGMVLAPSRASSAVEPVEFFELSNVRLLDSPFRTAQDRAREYLLAHDVDRFIAPFRVESGLQAKAPLYPNWESTGLAGHTAGHYLTALAQMWAATGDPEMKSRLDRMVAELAECQEAGGDGYIGGVPGGRALWAEVAEGRLRVDNFAINRKWVPWYNLHKTFAGLRDAWLIGGNEQARDVLINLSDWCADLCAQLSDAQMQEMLRAEHGGMNEVLADVYALTGDPNYLALAQRFSHRAILRPLLLHQDRLTGLHANTQIPKVIGFARIAELGGDPSWQDAADFFWETVTERRTVAFGGNSVREHFNPLDDFMPLIESNEGPETCNTFNMLRLTEQLFRGEPAAFYTDYYERALYNHILSSIHPEHGGFVYFTPLRPQHYRVYSQPEQCFWCCVGSGMENPGKYGQFIYARRPEALLVNLFIPSELTWPEAGLTLRQETAFPDANLTFLEIDLASPKRLALQVRYPGWVEPGALIIRINNEPWTVTASPASYEVIDREWQSGDRVDIELPMTTRVERLPDGSDYVALMHGPILLAARTGTNDLDGLIADDARFAHVASGRQYPLDAAPMLVGEFDTLTDHIKPVAGQPLTFTAHDILRPDPFRSLKLIPFYRLHDARYALYWHQVTQSEYTALVARLEEQERKRLELVARTLDEVAPGEQQPEVEHDYQGEDSNTGIRRGRRWRDAGGWFSYNLRTEPGTAVDLVVTYFDGDRDRTFDVLVNDERLATVRLGGGDDRFSDRVYPIPASVIEAARDGILTVKFVAHEQSRAGGVYGLRLVRRADGE